MNLRTASLLLLTCMPLQHGPATGPEAPPDVVIVEDFESYAPGALPARWKYLNRDQEFIPLNQVMRAQERFFVVEEPGNRFLRGYTKAEAQRITLANGDAFDWDLEVHPRLRWQWRARQLPEGAREDKVNDTGGAVYVSFDKKDWLGRPYSIKYTYSSSLPVGTVVSFGNLKVIVATSGKNEQGAWVSVDRNVAADYRRLFKADPPSRPFSITLWSDSDDTRSVGEVDFDDIVLAR